MESAALRRLEALDLGAWRRRADAAAADAGVAAEPAAHLDGPAATDPAAPGATAVAIQPGVLADWAVPGTVRRQATGVEAPSVRQLRQAVGALLASPVSGRPADVAAVLTLAEQLRGRGLRELAELETSGSYRDEAVTAAAWLRRRRVVSDDTARATLRLAGRLREELPALFDALEQGRTSLEHVRAVAAGTAGLDTDLVREAQPALLELTQVAEPAVVRRQLRERAEAIDPALGRDAARRQQARQGFFADPLAGGGVVLGGSLADDDGAVVLHGLDLCCEADRTAGDVRSLPARRAAVLVQWARDAALACAGPGDSGAQDAHTVRTHLLVTCTPQQLQRAAEQHAQHKLGAREAAPGWGPGAAALLSGAEPAEPARLPSGAPLLPAALRRLACDAALSLLVQASTGDLDRVRSAPVPPPSEVLHAGRSLRTVTAAQFKALVVRDRTCVVAGCHRRPAQCEAHHVQHWLDGGDTDLDNLVLLCHRHHHDHHDRQHDLQHRDGRWLTQHGWEPP